MKLNSEIFAKRIDTFAPVATVPTVYGIETQTSDRIILEFLVATVPTVYGIETAQNFYEDDPEFLPVATVPTVYGIETNANCTDADIFYSVVATVPTVYGIETLFTIYYCYFDNRTRFVATVPTVYGIETQPLHSFDSQLMF